MSERLRLFVALDLPAGVRAQLAGWCQLAAAPGVRRIVAENLHVTLAFLGSRSAQDAAAIATGLEGLARDICPLETAGALWLPPRGPGVLCVALADAPALTALHADVVAALGQAIGYEPDERPFRPHVTVGRIPRGTLRVPRKIDPPAPQLHFEASALTLYRSSPAPGGARYEPLATRRLLGADTS